MKAKICLLLLIILAMTKLDAQILRAFTSRYYNSSVRGNIVYVSNSIISTAGIGAGVPGTGEIPPAGTTTNSTGGGAGINIDVDADLTTFNSSTADLTLASFPSCSQILFAGLYWGAGQGNNGGNKAWITGETTCKLQLPGSPTYTTITSTQTDYWNNTLIPGYAHTGFQCFTDITALVTALASPNGTYAVANVASPAGIKDAYGGWTIVIAYYNPSLQVRNLTVFDGCAGVKTGSPAVDINISGFLTPLAGPVSCELGAVVYDGDRVSKDSFEFRQNGVVTNFVDLTPTTPAPGNATSIIGDTWNSTISYKGVVTTARNPAFQNTLGYDADIFEIPNAGNANLGNNKTGATVRFISPSENYITQVLSTSISQYNPTFAFDKTATDINGGSLLPGDVLRYQVNYNNVGNDASTNTIITDNIPAGTTFVPGSIKINGAAKTDAVGDDEAEYDFATNKVIFRLGTGANASNGGAVATSGSGNVQFDIATPSSCTVVTCNGPIQNSARISYIGQTSSDILYDSSGVNLAGCITKGPVISTLTGACYNPLDTILNNTCPSITKTLPYVKYAGYTFYSAKPFIAANIYNEFTPVTATGTYYAYYNKGVGCSDTITIRVFISGCPDIDDDRDGIPDYVEINLPAATQDLDGDGIPNWKDTDYPGFVDNNIDGFNDNFDPAADSDNDGIPNYYDTNFPGFVDTNGDGVNDNMDKDKDGIPNNFDKDSDNDGIPDVAESGGVDANGDGKIDNFTDTDNDGLSQNVDASNTGIGGSGNGLGAVDTDGDGVPNYLDIDSDNDGIPDVVEVYGTDANNDGRIDSYVDTDGDGYSDNVDGDVGNDGIAENAANTLLRTGADINGDGRADSYPYKNMDNDSKANPYDLDSDGDGITDVKEGFPTLDFNNDGRVDGFFNTNGWSMIVSFFPALNLPNTDATGRVNVYDIDSDNDGIPDNIEGQSTSAYQLPSGLDTDGDGIDNKYDNSVSFGGNGIPPVDTDGDGSPDYKDTDTDGDGVLDIYEGNDYNSNGLIDDGVVLSGTDGDGDGLDDFFDLLNSSAKGTSNKMGNGGSFIGDPIPGTKATVQRNASSTCPSQRDWRCVSYVLNCNIISFKATLQGKRVQLDWAALCQQEIDYFIVEKSLDGITFSYVGLVKVLSNANRVANYHDTDDVSSVKSTIIYYRLKSVSPAAKISYSNIVSVPLAFNSGERIQIVPNPVRDQLKITIASAKKGKADIQVFDENGKVLINTSENILPGNNFIEYPQSEGFPNGVYYLRIKLDENIITRKFNKLK